MGDKSEASKSQWKRRLFDIIQIGKETDIVSRLFDIFIVITIVSNILSMFLDTFSSLMRFHEVFRMIEYVTTAIFLIEYLLRIFTAEYLYPERTKFMARIRFLYSFEGIIDLLTIIPVFFLSGFVAFRMLRVVRIMNLFRINSHSDSFNVITSVIYDKRKQILSAVFIILVLMLASSLEMYSVEHDAQPEAFKNAFSGIWWSVSTILTVGYGDIYPVTVVGKLMATIIAFLGVGVVAIPTGIISAGFVERYRKDEKEGLYKEQDRADIFELIVTDKLSEKAVTDVRSEEGLFIYMILRNNMTIVPTDDTILKANDIIIAKMDTE